MNVNEALLPCPFCGGTAEWNTGQNGDGSPWRYIACEDCEAMGPHAKGDSASVAAWNRRAATTGKATGEAVERIKDLEAITITRNGIPDEISVSPEYVQRSLSWIDGLDAHEGPPSTQNVEDLIAIAREFAKGYAEHAGILKHVIADRERIKGERNDANAAAHESLAAPGAEAVREDAEVLRSLTQAILECRTTTDFLTVQKTVQAIAALDKPSPGMVEGQRK